MSHPSDDYKRGDTVLNPRSGYLFTAVGDGYGGLQWLELGPSASHAQDHPPADAVLVVRWVDGKPRPVTDLGDGGLYAVDVLRDAS